MLIQNYLFRSTSSDAAFNAQLGFQDPASINAVQVWFFYHDIMLYLIIFGVFVVVHLFQSLEFFDREGPLPQRAHTVFDGRELLRGHVWHRVDAPLVEVIWTIAPAISLILIGMPSLSLLYLFDEFVEPEITFKIIGHQWYWVYETDDFAIPVQGWHTAYTFESHMVPLEDLKPGAFRLLEVDAPLVLPIHETIRLAVTAYDVLHCWAVPSLGVKLDGCPGRINETTLFILRPGTFYGQCSEICGVNHGFMPIVVKGVSMFDYTWWVYSFYSEQVWQGYDIRDFHQLMKVIKIVNALG